MTEYGVFNDEGLIAGQFYSVREACEFADEIAADKEDREAMDVQPVCPDHTEQPARACGACALEDDDEDDEG